LGKIRAFLLAAGYGSRLKPYTESWPKCLMPIKNKPLLEYWLSNLVASNVNEIYINTHYLSEKVESFLKQEHLSKIAKTIYEPKLLGTAGSLRNNANKFHNKPLIVAHADNWVCTDLKKFINYHFCRPKNTVITMMTFRTDDPESCGIVETNKQGIVTNFYEKQKFVKSNYANGAVYIIEPEVIDFIVEKELNDFSNDVIPNFLGRIATWENTGIHRDIGSIESLRKAQKDNCNSSIWTFDNDWMKSFLKNNIHKELFK